MTKNKLLLKDFTHFPKSLIVLALFILFTTSNSVFAQNWNQIIKKVASDRAIRDIYGSSIAISGDYAIIGAKGEDEDTLGGNTLADAGSVYILKNISGSWSEVQKLVASDRGFGDLFGHSVAISGEYAIVGAIYENEDTSGGNTLTNAGAAYIFKNNAGTWSEVQKLVASDRGALDFFGKSVAISGNYAIVGAHQEDHDTSGGNALISAGSAYIFKNNSGNWSEVRKVVASDRDANDLFGFKVAISGNYAIVSAISESHDTSGIGYASLAGSAYVFKNNAGSWSEVQKIVASDRQGIDRFGSSVAISGDYAIIGARGEDHDTSGGNFNDGSGSAYIFKNNSGSWSEVQKIVASDRGQFAEFGGSVAISGDYSIIGARGEARDRAGGNILYHAGAAYIFKNNAGTWSEQRKLVTSDRATDDRFGNSVAILGDYSIVCAYQEDEDTIGRNTLAEAGAAYVFSCTSRKSDVRTACDSLTWIDGITYMSNNNTATDTLTNRAGCDSIITLNLTLKKSISNDTVTACDRYTWIANNITYAKSGVYSDTLTNTLGCDSILMLNLTIDGVSDLTTTTSGLVISANNTSATYQWIDCGNNNASIVGDTGQTFTGTPNGYYAVELTENGCVDTSACVRIITVGIVENSLNNKLLVFPNPSRGNFSIDLGAIYEKTQVLITNISGKLIDSKTISQSKVLEFSISEPAGIYIISIQAGNKKAVIRLVKE